MENNQKQPAFDNPETIHAPEKPMVYHNFANNYGKTEVPKAAAPTGISPRDRIQIGVMIALCGLCLGIAGVLGYFLAVLP